MLLLSIIFCDVLIVLIRVEYVPIIVEFNVEKFLLILFVSNDVAVLICAKILFE